MTWTLIVFVTTYHGTQVTIPFFHSNKAITTQSSVPGFKSEAACQKAAEQVKHLSGANVKTACVSGGE